MTYDEAKMKLNSYRISKNRLKSVERQIEIYRENCIALGLDYSNPNVFTSAKPDAPYVKWVLACKDLEQTLREERQQLMQELKETKDLIAMVEDERQRTVLEMIYIEGMDPYKVGDELHYSVHNIRKIQYSAIKRIAESVV